MSFHLHTSCIDSTAEFIYAMQDAARDVTYRTMLKHCPGLLDWAVSVGYARHGRSGELTLKEDWAVSYHRSQYCGKPCYYVCWSAIEYIFVETV